jgi:hypothetical protein
MNESARGILTTGDIGDAATSESDSVESFLRRIQLAWDSGNVRAYAQEFAEDATYVIFRGSALLGREEIERNHVLVFQRWQRRRASGRQANRAARPTYNSAAGSLGARIERFLSGENQ